jgi:uncharacterized RDD family membrane protein YckC
MTVENASLLRRLAAIVYDSLLVLAVLMLTTLPFVGLRGGEPVATNSNLGYQLTLLIVIFAFFVGFWTRTGSTLGMQSWGLRVEGLDGKPPTLVAASVRFFAAILSWLTLGVGFVWQLWDKDEMTWHDKLSGTRLRYYPKKAKAKKTG